MRRPVLEALVIAISAAILVGSAFAYAPRARIATLELPITSTALDPIAVKTVARDRIPPLSIRKQVADGHHWRIETPRGPIHVWTPHGYAARTAVTVVYVHGYFTEVDNAWYGHQLPEQFALSGINAMFIAASAPSGKARPVAWPSLTALLHTVERRIELPMPEGSVVAVGHSGAHRTLDHWLVNRRLDTVVLIDAAYGDIWSYRRWLIESPQHRLIDIGDDTVGRTDELHRALPSTVVLDPFPVFGIPESARDARILYIRSELGHMPLVTGGIALPTVLRALRVKRVLTAPIPYPYF